jgi:hypothetical protein
MTGQGGEFNFADFICNVCFVAVIGILHRVHYGWLLGDKQVF